MLADARPLGIAPPTIPFGVLPDASAWMANRPSGGDLLGKVKEHHSIFKHVPDCAIQPIVAGEITDVAPHHLARVSSIQPLSAAIEGKFQQVPAFKCIKHEDPSELCPETAQKMVNIRLNPRTMEAAHA